MNHLEDILIPLFFFAFTFGSLYIYITSTHREKMALIERGVDTDKFYNKRSKNLFLKFGFLFVGAGLGFLIGLLLSPFFHYDASVGIIISSSFLFSGIFMVIGYLFELKMEKKQISSEIVNID